MLQDLIGYASYMAHGYCLFWNPWLVSVHASADALIAASYFAIPIAIWIFLRRRPGLELRGLALMFAAFILLCGASHVFGLITLWYPVYELQGAAKALTAVVSAATAFAIFPLLPKALAIPSPRELAQTNAELTQEIAAHEKTLRELEEARAALQRTVADQSRDLETSEQRFHATQEAFPEGFMFFNSVRDDGNRIVDFEVAYMNAAAAEILGRREVDLLGKRMLEQLPGNQTVGLFDAYASVVETGEPIQKELEYHHEGIDGWFRVTAVKAGDGFGVSFSDISERIRRAEQLHLLMREVNHRSKNILAVVEAIVRMTARASDPSNFLETLQGRLHGLSASHDLILDSEYTNVDMASLIQSQLAHLDEAIGERIMVEGAPLRINSQAAQGIGLAIHELATNALKYGALSNEKGTVHISWTLAGTGNKGRLELSWEESGGPPVEAPERKGFGHTVMERMAAQSVNGEVDVKFFKKGVRWRLSAPAADAMAMQAEQSQRR